MKIIRWFFSHTFLILLIVAVIYSYMYWGNLIGEDTPAGKALAYLSDEFETVDEFMVAVRAKQAQQEPGAAESAQPMQSAQQDQQAEAVHDDAGQAAEQEIAQDTGEAAQLEGGEELAAEPVTAAEQAVSISYSHNQQRVEQDSAGSRLAPAAVATQTAETAEPDDAIAAGDTGAIDKPVDTAVRAEAWTPDSSLSAALADEHFVSEEISEQLDNVDESGRVIDPAKGNEMVRQEWIRARQAFYMRDYEQSEKSYLQVIDSTRDNVDAYGELGNVYFNQGKKQQAAQAYFDAASILVRRGEKMRARSLMGLLRRLDAAKADELQKLVEESAG